MSIPSVETFLADLAAVAAESVSPPASCGITLRRERQPITVASSDATAAAVDEVQYHESEGACLEALDTGRVVLVSDLIIEQRWGGYPAQAAAHGVRSSLSVPLYSNRQAIGALKLYAATPHAFDDPTEIAQVSALAAQADAVLSVVTNQADQPSSPNSYAKR